MQLLLQYVLQYSANSTSTAGSDSSWIDCCWWYWFE